jgi:hypothetical protein
MRMDGGLHPMYLELHGLGGASEQEHKDNKMLLEASQSDVFDTVSFFFCRNIYLVAFIT